MSLGPGNALTWLAFGDLHRLSLSLAKMLERDMGFPDISCLSPGKIIALLCPSSEELLITWLALVKSGYGVLLIAFVSPLYTIVFPNIL